MNFGGFLAGAAGLPQGYMQAQQFQQEQQRAQVLQQVARAQLADRLRQQQQAAGNWQVAQTPDFASMMQQAQAMPTQLPAGGILGDQTNMPAAPPPTGGIPAPLIPAVRALVQRDESGGRNIPNQQGPGGTPASSASGLSQITDPTWRENAPRAGVDPNQYPRAMAAPPAAQNAVTDGMLATQGVKPWQSNQRLMADLHEVLGPETAQAAAAAAPAVAAQIPPGVAGKVGKEGLAQLIQRTLPDAPDDVKFGIFQSLSGVLAPAEKQQVAVMMAELKGRIAERLKDTETPYQKENLAERTRHDQAMEGKGAGGGESGGYEASKTLEILDKDGNVVRTVLGREGRKNVGFVDSTTGQPLKLEAGQQVREITPSSGGGGRAGAQAGRQQIGAREVLSDLQNTMLLPLGTTTGMLGQAEPGKTITGALTGDLVRTITGQDQQLMQASMANMSRELSILLSPVYGGNWAAQQIDPLIPKSGDSLGTVAFKVARLAQTADNALEASSKMPVLSNDQKQYAKEMRDGIRKAIYWTPAQALEFARSDDPNKTFDQFIKGGHGGGGVTPGSGGGLPQVSDQKSYDALKAGSQYIGPDGQTRTKQ